MLVLTEKWEWDHSGFSGTEGKERKKEIKNCVLMNSVYVYGVCTVLRNLCSDMISAQNYTTTSVSISNFRFFFFYFFVEF